jgi:hypothetical protein
MDLGDLPGLVEVDDGTPMLIAGLVAGERAILKEAQGFVKGHAAVNFNFHHFPPVVLNKYYLLKIVSKLD